MDPRAPSGLGQRLYDDFAPRSDWLREERIDTLIVDLPGFKKEELKVQMDNYGNLKLSGEHQLSGNRWTRFRKDFKIPKSCNAGEIRAKFDKGLLYILMPKLIEGNKAPESKEPQGLQPPPTPASPPTTTPPPTPAPLPASGAVQTPSPPPPPPPSSAGDRRGTPLGDAKKGGSGDLGGGGADGSNGGIGLATTRRKVALLNVAVALVVLVAIGVYVVFWWKGGSELFEDEIGRVMEKV